MSEPFPKFEMKFEPVDPTMPPANPGPLEVVRGPFRKYEMTLEATDPSMPPATPGPLNHVRRRFRRIEMKFEPADPTVPLATPGPLDVVPGASVRLEGEFDLVLTLDSTADADEVLDRVSPQEVRTQLVGLFRELNDYSLLKWGKGLTTSDFRQNLPAGGPEVKS